MRWLCAGIAVPAGVAAVTGLLLRDGPGPFRAETVRGQEVEIARSGLYRSDTVFTATGSQGTDPAVLAPATAWAGVLILRRRAGVSFTLPEIIGPMVGFVVLVAAAAAVLGDPQRRPRSGTRPGAGGGLGNRGLSMTSPSTGERQPHRPVPAPKQEAAILGRWASWTASLAPVAYSVAQILAPPLRPVLGPPWGNLLVIAPSPALILSGCGERCARRWFLAHGVLTPILVLPLWVPPVVVLGTPWFITAPGALWQLTRLFRTPFPEDQSQTGASLVGEPPGGNPESRAEQREGHDDRGGGL